MIKTMLTATTLALLTMIAVDMTEGKLLVKLVQ